MGTVPLAVLWPRCGCPSQVEEASSLVFPLGLINGVVSKCLISFQCLTEPAVHH